MAHPDTRLLIYILLGNQLPEFAGKEQIARHGEDAGQRGGVGQARHDGHGRSLGEATQHDPMGWDALLVPFGVDQLVQRALRTYDARFVGGFLVQVVEARDVVPSRHAHPHVDADRDHGRVREDE